MTFLVLTRKVKIGLICTYSTLLLLLVTLPLPRDGGMAEDMEPQKPGNSPGSGPEVVQRQRVAKE